MDDLERYRDEWEYLSTGCLWLQHAGITPLCRRVRQQAVAAMAAFGLDPRGAYGELWQRATVGAREAVGALIGAPPEQIALVKNTSLGLSMVAIGFPYRAGQNLVTIAGEYPANRLAWRAAVPEGVTIRVVEPEPDGRIPVDRVAAAVDHQTCLVAVSWVQYLNGFRIDLDALGEVCQRHGAYLVVDGVQGLGAIPIDLGPVDALAAGGHKWLCGSEGAGFLYLSPRLLEVVRPFNVSWHSTAERLDRPGAEIPTETGVPPLKPTAERFEEGTPNTYGSIMLAEAAEMLAEVGTATIFARIGAWHDALAAELEPRGYQITSSRRPAERSGILCLRHPSHDTNDLVRRLGEAGITAIRRAGSVRLSPHFYNTLDDAARAAAALP